MATATLTPPVGTGQGPIADSLYEIVNGECREQPSMGVIAGFLASYLHGLLAAHGRARSLGLAAIEVLFELRADGRVQRRPDVAFVRLERIAESLSLDNDLPVWRVVPNLAVEVVSPTNTAADLLRKIEDYFAAGVELVWVIYPQQRCIYVYESPTQVRILTEADELTGEPAVPGFRLRIAELFADFLQPQDALAARNAP